MTEASHTATVQRLREYADIAEAGDKPHWAATMREAVSLLSEKASMIPLEPTPAMIEAGAQRLVRWETGKEKWPESWNWIEVRAARQEAERVWRSMWLEAKDSPCTSGAQALSGRGADEAEMAPIGLEGDRVAVTGTRTTAVSAEVEPLLLNWLREKAPDCGDNSCLFGGRGKGGMRTNGGCRCFKDVRPDMHRIFIERMWQAVSSMPSATAERMFPMQDGPAIPWSLAEVIWQGYAALFGKGQKLERVGERGGFGWAEVAHFWSKPKAREAMKLAAADRTEADRG